MGLSSGSDDSEQVGIGTGDSPAAALIDLLLDLAANDARLPADAAQKLDKIAQEAARLVVLYMTEKPLYEDGVPAGNQTLDPKREAAV